MGVVLQLWRLGGLAADLPDNDIAEIDDFFP